MKSYSEGSAQTDNSMMHEEKVHVKVLHEVEYLRKKVDEESKIALHEKARQDSVRSDYICINCNKERQDGLSLLDSQKLEIERLEKLLKSSDNDLKRQKKRLEEELLKTQEMENKITIEWKKREGDFQNIQDKLQQKLHKDNRRMEEEGLAFEEMRSSSDKAQLKVKELESQLEILKEQNNIQHKQNKSLQAMLESMADYEVVKSDLLVTKRELELALSRYQDSQIQWLNTKDLLEKKIAELTLKITSPCLELLTANTEVQKMIEKQEQDRSSWNKERGHWQKELHQERLRVEELKQHIENLNKIIQSLQFRLENSHVSDIQANVLFTNSNVTATHSRPAVTSDRLSPTPSPQSRINYLQEAKKRIEMLQAEADALETKYGQFMKNQKTFLSPNETLYSPFANPRIYFNHPSYTNSTVPFASSGHPKIGNFFLDEHYQVVAQLEADKETKKDTLNLQNYVYSTVSDFGRKFETDSVTRITPPAQHSSHDYSYSYPRLDPNLASFQPSNIIPEAKNSVFNESRVDDAVTPRKEGPLLTSDQETLRSLSKAHERNVDTVSKPDVNEMRNSSQSSFASPSIAGLVSSPAIAGKPISEITPSFKKLEHQTITKTGYISSNFGPVFLDNQATERTMQTNSLIPANGTVDSTTKVLQTKKEELPKTKSATNEVNLDSEWKKSSMLSPIHNPENPLLGTNLNDAWKKQARPINTSVLNTQYALETLEGNQRSLASIQDNSAEVDNPRAQQNIQHYSMSPTTTVVSPMKSLQTEQKDLHEMKSGLNEGFSEVNLDSEWRKTSGLTTSRNTGNNLLEINLDAAWKNQTRAVNTSVLNINNAFKVPETNRKLVRPNNEEKIEDNLNSNGFIKEKSDGPNNESSNVALTARDNDGVSSENNQPHDAAEIGDNVRVTEVANSVNRVQAKDQNQTEIGVSQSTSFVPENHSTPIVRSLTAVDTGGGSENSKSDNSEMNLSIGDQAVPSENSNSESLW